MRKDTKKKLAKIIRRLEHRLNQEIAVCKALENDDIMVSYSCKTFNKYNRILGNDIAWLKGLQDEK